MEDLGLCILRFKNEEVEEDIEKVLNQITSKINNQLGNENIIEAGS